VFRLLQTSHECSSTPVQQEHATRHRHIHTPTHPLMHARASAPGHTLCCTRPPWPAFLRAGCSSGGLPALRSSRPSLGPACTPAPACMELCPAAHCAHVPMRVATPFCPQKASRPPGVKRHLDGRRCGTTLV